MATVSDRSVESWGPLEEYDRRVAAGILRNDEHQRGEALSTTKMCELLSLGHEADWFST